MNQNKEIVCVITYENFLRIPDKIKQEMLKNNQVEWFISIKSDEYAQLSEEEQQKFAGFKCTEKEPLCVEIVDSSKLFRNEKILETMDIKMFKNEKKEDKKHFRPYVPKKMGIICTKKKGGR